MPRCSDDITGVVENIESDSPTDLQKISIWHQGTKYTFYNIYNPPWNNMTFNAFSETNFQRTIVAGDFNAHSPEWGYTNYNKTGKAIEEFCESTNLTVLQDENSPPTLLFKVNKEKYRPDLTLISSDLLNRHAVDVLDLKLGGGDHSPILTSIFTKKKKKFKQRTKWNFKKANWDLFREKSDSKLQSVTNSDYASPQ